MKRAIVGALALVAVIPSISGADDSLAPPFDTHDASAQCGTHRLAACVSRAGFDPSSGAIDVEISSTPDDHVGAGSASAVVEVDLEDHLATPVDKASYELWLSVNDMLVEHTGPLVSEHAGYASVQAELWAEHASCDTCVAPIRLSKNRYEFETSPLRSSFRIGDGEDLIFTADVQRADSDDPIPAGRIDLRFVIWSVEQINGSTLPGVGSSRVLIDATITRVRRLQ